ncbi:MAG TPA: putative lipid II flippase FtsW [Dehalococcoidia bacterium]|nr:putative lipid II flippase FtsW [Dehalococcoidia bacterium]
MNGVMSLRAKVSEGQPDRLLLAAVGVLIMVGLQMVYSSSFGYALTAYNDAGYLALRQALWALVGFALLLVFSRVDYHIWRDLSLIGMAISVLALIAVHLPMVGVSSYGATRWLRLGPLPPIQPSEFIKLPMVIYVSAWLTGRGDKLRNFSAGLAPFVVLMGLVGGLIMLQPDLGTTVVILLTAGALFFIAGASLRHLLILVAIAAVAGLLLVLGAEYRSGRIESFLDPWKDPQGKGFHIIQSLVALGSGGFWGLGLGASRQKFFYVPGSHTDAIFAIIGEELGFIGVVGVMALFAFLLYRGFRLAFRAPDQFGVLLASGITFWFAFQVVIKIGGITRSIPFTGIPLPFLSYGGSALAISLAAVGILINISKQSVGGGTAISPGSRERLR